VCVCLFVCLCVFFMCLCFLLSVCAPGHLPGPHPGDPPVLGADGGLVHGRDHHLQAPAEGSHGAHDGLEKVHTGM